MAMSDSSQSRDGVYLIRPGGTAGHSRTARVYCERDSQDSATAWTLIQRRVDGRVSFARTWDEYRAGFGDPSTEYWLGNDFTSLITSTSRSYRLRVDMWDVMGRFWTAEYATFRVRPAEELFRLELGDGSSENGVGESGRARGGSFSGNVSDSLMYSDRQPFSAIDKDNDVSTTDCARFYAAGWWYKHCHYANLNGRYTSGVVWFNEAQDEWLQLRQTVMKIAPSTSSSPPQPVAAAAEAAADSPSPTSDPAAAAAGAPGAAAGAGAGGKRRHKVKSHQKTVAAAAPSDATVRTP